MFGLEDLGTAQYVVFAILAVGLCLSLAALLWVRMTGFSLVGLAMLLVSAPAHADESILAVDNGEVRCTASQRDLTRISLKDDQFVAVSKVETGNPLEEFSLVHEPTRGDIYISVPEGYLRPNVSFFGTTQKGFVYKFTCRVEGDEARQVFVANADVEHPQSPATQFPSQASVNERAVGLVKAMFEQRRVEGFEISDVARAPVNVGAMKVQLITQYQSPTMAGRVLRIENTGSEAITLTEELVAQGAIAVSISNRNLQPGEATAAYVVVPGREI